MRLKRQVVSGLLAWTALITLTGCPGEDGAREGINEGVSAAVAALIETPVTHWLEERFAEPQ